MIRQPERKGLIKARMRGVKEAGGDVLVFFDSHMEVNIEWYVWGCVSFSENVIMFLKSTHSYESLILV